jgi:hypothetical protein
MLPPVLDLPLRPIFSFHSLHRITIPSIPSQSLALLSLPPTSPPSLHQADAVLHFGTHGSLEFMPGKQVGMSGVCYPDSLIGTIPNIYYYAANNPSGE